MDHQTATFDSSARRAAVFFSCALVLIALSQAAAATTSDPPAGEAEAAGVIRFLEARVRKDPEDFMAQNRLAGEYLTAMQRTGDIKYLESARAAAEASLLALPAELNPGGLLVRGRVEYESHDFAAARDTATRLVELADKPTSYALLGDALLELGDAAAAAEAYARLEELAPGTVDAHARLARLARVRGDAGGAQKHLEAALDAARELGRPAPDAVAWCLLKLGETCFSRGDWDGAERHYQEAMKTVPGSYAAAERVGELRAAQGRYEEALSLYEDVVRRVPRPELFHALGDVYRAAGRGEDAKGWHAKALDGYLRSANAGVAHFYHHLAGYYADVEKDGAEAVKWARKDLEVRRTTAALDALAWALHAAGDFAAAASAMDEALTRGTGDAHVLYHASLIYFRAGNAPKARDCLTRAAVANPKFREFHVHR